jgi:hypothetical protein
LATTLERPLDRARSERPTRRSAASGGHGLGDVRPSGRRPVRLPELIVGIVLVGACALAAVWWQTSHSARQPVAVLSHAVTAGQLLTDADLRPADVALGEGVRAVAWADRGALVGKAVVTDLPDGVALVPGLVSDEPALAPGEALVGLLLEPGAYPAGSLQHGDAVAVVAAATPQAAEGGVLAADASVWDLGAIADHEGATLLTLRLAEADAARVSAAADHVRVVRVVR